MNHSVLDEPGDVKLFTDAMGGKYVARDNVCHGLDLHRGDRCTEVHRNGHLIATIRCDADRSWVAAWMPSGKTAARHDTHYGLIAKLARMVLQPAACCKGEAR